jgi:ABC-type phosphate transport system substrate-binding protein
VRSRPWRGDVIGRDSASGNDAKSLIDKICDFADMSVPMKDSEHFAAKANRVNHVQNVIALDGIAFVVHPHSGSHIKVLNRDRIREYYISERASPSSGCHDPA